MSSICTAFPYVGDELSILYKELLQYTNKNRKLTNYLYAIALSDFKKQFAPSEFNTQGELNASILIQSLDVDDILSAQLLIEHAEKSNELKAKDSYGNIIYYDSVESIIDNVLDFNKKPGNNLIAKIIKEDNKYYIEVDTINDSNFDFTNRLEIGKKQLSIVELALTNTGFDLSLLSDRGKLGLNALNAFTAVNNLLNLASKNSKLNYGSLALALDLLLNNKLVSRFLKQCDDYQIDPIKTLKFVLSENRNIPDELNKNGSSLWLIDQIKDKTSLTRQVRNIISIEFRKVNTILLASLLTNIYSSEANKDQIKLRKKLDSLYEKWLIDKDTISLNYKNIDTLLELLLNIISRLKGMQKLFAAKGLSNYSLTLNKENIFADIIRIESLINQKENASAIYVFLDQINNVLANMTSIDTSDINENSLLLNLNKKAKDLYVINQYIEWSLPVIKALLDKDIYESDIDTQDRDTIIALATDLYLQLNVISKQYRTKQFDIVANFIDRFVDIQALLRSEEDKLLDKKSLLVAALNCADKDINYFDRFLAVSLEVSDPIISALGSAIKSIHEERDEAIRNIQYKIRVATAKLYRSNSSTDFMFETTSRGEVKIVSDIDWNRYYEEMDKEELKLKDQGVKGMNLLTLLSTWVENHTEVRIFTFGNNSKGLPILTALRVPIFKKSLNLTLELLDYYNEMMGIKLSMEAILEASGTNTDIFTPVLMTRGIIDENSDIDLKGIKTNFVNKFKFREDDLEYNLETVVDADNLEVRALPIFYIDKLKNLDNLSKDFSKTILAFSSMALNYGILSERIHLLELSKDFLLNVREVQLNSGNKKKVSYIDTNRSRLVTSVTKKGRETDEGSFLNDLYDRQVYSMHTKDSGTVAGLSIDKMARAATEYASTTGLVMNVPGAIANALVGKLQMLIEAGASEFWNLKSMSWATKEYYKLLPELLGEVNTQAKKSKLNLLMEKFDVLDDFNEKVKETGFYKNGLNKILGNTNLFFLYGLGEHLLHAQGMLACLNYTKVLDKNGKEVPLYEVFEVQEEHGVGKLNIKKGYTTKKGTVINEAYIAQFKKKVSYVNQTLHGAFGTDEKGMIHLYAFGKLIMNFRQWMPGHYGRRFNKKHWDTRLGDYREGYYITLFKFVRNSLKDLKKGLAGLAYKNLDKMQKANLKRCLSELGILITLSLLVGMSFGDDPKHRGWWEALCKYELKRMLMETLASSPFAFYDFINSNLTLINNPIPALSSTLRFTRLFGLGDLITWKKVLTGPHAGELVYFRNVERFLPFYEQVNKWWNMDVDNSIFQVFNMLRN